jgi:hypothetical protein
MTPTQALDAEADRLAEEAAKLRAQSRERRSEAEATAADYIRENLGDLLSPFMWAVAHHGDNPHLVAASGNAHNRKPYATLMTAWRLDPNGNSRASLDVGFQITMTTHNGCLFLRGSTLLLFAKRYKLKVLADDLDEKVKRTRANARAINRQADAMEAFKVFATHDG